MAHSQKPRFRLSAKKASPFKSAGGRHFSRLLAAELYASAVVMLDTTCSDVVWRILATHSIPHFSLQFPSVRHRVPPHLNWSLPFVPSITNCCPRVLTLILLTWRIWWAPNNASKWQMGFNSAFKGLIMPGRCDLQTDGEGNKLCCCRMSLWCTRTENSLLHDKWR